MKKYFFITGTSRGIGKEFATQLMDKDHVLFLISRSGSDLQQKALENNCRIHDISFDLSETEKIDPLLTNLFDHIEKDTASGIFLINNAGITGPVSPIDQAGEAEIRRSVAVNFLAPVQLTASFIRQSQSFAGEKSILNITSGAAHIPHHGMSMYCATKAALDQFTRSVGLEQDSDRKVKIHAISPGFVDTGMPNDLIGKSADQFADAAKFKEAKEKGKFAAPEAVARNILQLWLNGKLEHGQVTHLYEYGDVH